MNRHQIFDRRQLILLLWSLLTLGFMAVSVIGYQVSKRAIRDAIIGQDLPLTSSNIYSEIQKDLVRPVIISSTMAHDTFVRDWVLRGETNVNEMARYLKEVKERHGAFSSFFVSESSATYYTGEGILKKISPQEPRDSWYYRVRDMEAHYEINVDPDLANADALTIFINYRVFDYAGHYIGATGVGLTVDAVRRLINEYQDHYQRTIYFVDQLGKIVVLGNQDARKPHRYPSPAIGPLIEEILSQKTGSWQYEADGDNHILHVNYLPELNWYLFVEQNESVALAGIRQTLYANLGISTAITLIVMFLIHLALMRYQSRIEEMAATDKLTGLLNRHAFTVLTEKLLAEYRRTPQPIAVILVDIDHFKSINDRYGHLAGDDVLEEVAKRLQKGLRTSDLAVRWGGEEFLFVLKGCDLQEAARIAENLRQSIASRPVITREHSIAISISLGISEYHGEELLNYTVDRADAALYQAKNSGRNQVITLSSGT